MYFYIVDPQNLTQKNFERVQSQLYSSLSEHKINGEISRVTTLRTVPQLVEVAFQRGVKTLVAVGTDETLQEVINASKGRDVTLAYIPFARTELSKILGLADIDGAARTIASRRVEQLDLGIVNNNWFFTRLTFGELEQESGGLMSFFKKNVEAPMIDMKFSADGKYNGALKVVAGTIINARDNSGGDSKLANPTDSVLDVMMLPANSGYRSWQHKKDLLNGYFENIPGCSLVHLQKIEITSPEGLAIKSAGKIIAKTPAIIEILPKALKMIVGRDRTF